MKQAGHWLVIPLWILLYAFSSFAQTVDTLVTVDGEWSEWSVSNYRYASEFPFSEGTIPLLTVLANDTFMNYDFSIESFYPAWGAWSVPDEFTRPARDLTDFYAIDADGQLFSRDGITYDLPPLVDLEIPTTFNYNTRETLILSEPEENDSCRLYLLPGEDGWGDAVLDSFSYGTYGNFDLRRTTPEIRWFNQFLVAPIPDSIGVRLIDLGWGDFERTVVRDTVLDHAVMLFQNGLVANQHDFISAEIYHLYELGGYPVYPRFTIPSLDGELCLPACPVIYDQASWVVQRDTDATLMWTHDEQLLNLELEGRVTRLRMVDAIGDSDSSVWLLWSVFNPWEGVTHLVTMRVDVHHWDVDEASPTAQPFAITLHPAYPNPFNASTVVPFELSKAGLVRISVIDLLGREVGVIRDGLVPAGQHKVSWQPSAALASGTYLLRLEQEGQQVVRRVQLVK